MKKPKKASARKSPVCPTCREHCEKIYRDKDGYAVGCEDCVRRVDAYDRLETDYALCPKCGNPCDTLYVNQYDEIVGCFDCIEITDAWTSADAFVDAEV